MYTKKFPTRNNCLEKKKYWATRLDKLKRLQYTSLSNRFHGNNNKPSFIVDKNIKINLVLYTNVTFS